MVVRRSTERMEPLTERFKLSSQYIGFLSVPSHWATTWSQISALDRSKVDNRAPPRIHSYLSTEFLLAVRFRNSSISSSSKCSYVSRKSILLRHVEEAGRRQHVPDRRVFEGLLESLGRLCRPFHHQRQRQRRARRTYYLNIKNISS